ncbi:MAG: SDR family NAD(P)-dependent oxidoreductase [Bacteriovoracaceae bacterium]
MNLPNRALSDQVILITGATSGIAPSLIRIAGNHHAKIFMVDKDEVPLQKLQDELRQKGHDSAFAVADLTEKDQAKYVTDACLKKFGRIDTWINNPKALIGKMDIDENFISFINSCKIAAQSIKNTAYAGSIINIVPPGQKSFLKAVARYTNNLKRKIKKLKLPINILLVIPQEDFSGSDILECATVNQGQRYSDNLKAINYLKPSFAKGVIISAFGYLLVKGLKKI